MSTEKTRLHLSVMQNEHSDSVSVFRMKNLAKISDTLKFELSIREKSDEARTPYFHLAVSSKVKKFTEDEKWLLKKLIDAEISGKFNVVVDPN